MQWKLPFTCEASLRLRSRLCLQEVWSVQGHFLPMFFLCLKNKISWRHAVEEVQCCAFICHVKLLHPTGLSLCSILFHFDVSCQFVFLPMGLAVVSITRMPIHIHLNSFIFFRPFMLSITQIPALNVKSWLTYMDMKEVRTGASIKSMERQEWRWMAQLFCQHLKLMLRWINRTN